MTRAREAAERLRHDLGKAVFLAQGFLGAEPSDLDLGDALRSDLLATRRGPAGTADVGAVWDELAGALDRTAPEYEPLAHAVEDLRSRLATLRGSAPARADLEHLHATSARIRALCAAWERRTRAGP